MQPKNVTAETVRVRKSATAKGWLFCVGLIGFVSYLTSVSVFAASSPPATHSFDALMQLNSDDDYYITLPRPVGAVSRFYVMTPLNDGRILFQDKVDGSHFGPPIDDEDFWTSGTPPIDCGIWGCDPVQPAVVFDPSVNRWYFVENDHALPGRFFVGVSKKEDPRVPTDWYKWAVLTTNFNAAFPRIGFTNKWVGIVWDGNTVFNDSYSQISVFDKAALVAGHEPVGSGTGQNYKNISGSHSQGIFMFPAKTYDPDVADLFLLQSTKYYNSGGTNDRLIYYRITGDTAADVHFVQSQGTEVVADSPWGVMSVDFPQKGVQGLLIQHDDDRIRDCIYRNGCLWAVQTATALTIPNPPPISAIQWWQIKPGTGSGSPTIVQRGLIRGAGPSGDGNFRAFPSLAVNANENVLVGYSLFGYDLYPSGAYSFRFGTDSLNSMRTEGVCGAGLGPWVPGDPLYLWGDRSVAVIDPIDDRSMWTLQEFTGSTPVTTPTPGEPPIEPETPGPRLWATHWIGVSVDFGRFVAGQGHSLGLDPVTTTALAASGRNNYGQLGNNSTTSVNSPVSPGGSQPPSSFQLYNIMDVAAGLCTSLAVDTFGTVFVWGANNAGQLGAGFQDFSPHSTPTPVPCASPLPCWSGNFNLFKRDNDGQPYYVPVSTGFGISPTLVSYKLTASAAVDYLGRVWMWGLNSYGQLGDGTTTPHFTPALVTLPLEVPAFDGVVSIETADYTTMALKADRSVWSWGSGCSGVLGDGDTSCLSTHYVTHPQQVLTGPGQPLAGVVQVACGRLSDFCLALTQDGTVYGWGANGSNQLGLGDTVNRGYAELIPNFGSIRRIAAGGYHSLALASDGRVYAWGQGGYGQTGFGTTGGRSQATPRLMEGTNSEYTDIAAGNNFSLMIRGNAEPPQVWGTGDNTYGQLATGSSTSLYSLPTQTLY